MTTVSSGLISTGIDVVSGDFLTVSNGGSAVSTTVSSGGFDLVHSGGVAVSTILSGGTEAIYAGGTASFTTVSSGGKEVALSGGLAVDATVYSGGSALVSPGGSAIGTTVSGGAAYVESGGSAVGTIVSSGGNEFVDGTASGTIVDAAGSETVVFPGSTVSDTVNNGGFLAVETGGVSIGTTVNSGGIEVIYTQGSASLTVLNSGGQIDVTTLPYTSGGSASLDSSLDMLTVSVDGRNALLQLAGNYDGIGFELTSDGGLTSGTLVTAEAAACYCAGTLIGSERGEVPVEALRIGDRVASVFGDMAEVTWLGYRRIDCRRHPKPADVWPVRIARGAFGPGLPRRDLLLSPDHAVYVGGVLIPIRYLVNGATICQEAVDEVMYWHVELPAHDVIFAEGLPAESYLDTGNRSAFANGGGATMLHPDFALRIWETKACARLLVEGQALTEIRRDLLTRARSLGFTRSDDPELRLRVGNTLVAPRSIASGTLRFALPADARAGEVCLVSRAGVPAEMNADANDHRRLGVMVTRIVLRGPGWQQEIPLDAAAFGEGFYPLECDPPECDAIASGHDNQEVARTWRWTDGCGRLALPDGISRDSTLWVDVHIACWHQSWVGPEENKLAHQA